MSCTSCGTSGYTMSSGSGHRKKHHYSSSGSCPPTTSVPHCHTKCRTKCHSHPGGGSNHNHNNGTTIAPDGSLISLTPGGVGAPLHAAGAFNGVWIITAPPPELGVSAHDNFGYVIYNTRSIHTSVNPDGTTTTQSTYPSVFAPTVVGSRMGYNCNSATGLCQINSSNAITSSQNFTLIQNSNVRIVEQVGATAIPPIDSNQIANSLNNPSVSGTPNPCAFSALATLSMGTSLITTGRYIINVGTENVVKNSRYIFALGDNIVIEGIGTTTSITPDPCGGPGAAIPNPALFVITMGDDLLVQGNHLIVTGTSNAVFSNYSTVVATNSGVGIKPASGTTQPNVTYATIVGGDSNRIGTLANTSGQFSMILGGTQNEIQFDTGSVIIGSTQIEVGALGILQPTASSAFYNFVAASSLFRILSSSNSAVIATVDAGNLINTDTSVVIASGGAFQNLVTPSAVAGINLNNTHSTAVIASNDLNMTNTNFSASIGSGSFTAVGDTDDPINNLVVAAFNPDNVSYTTYSSFNSHNSDTLVTNRLWFQGRLQQSRIRRITASGTDPGTITVDDRIVIIDTSSMSSSPEAEDCYVVNLPIIPPGEETQYEGLSIVIRVMRHAGVGLCPGVTGTGEVNVYEYDNSGPGIFLLDNVGALKQQFPCVIVNGNGAHIDFYPEVKINRYNAALEFIYSTVTGGWTIIRS